MRDWIAGNTKLNPSKPRVYGYPAGVIGNVCIAWAKEINEAVPPLNAIIVNGISHLPSGGADYYLRWFQK